MKKALAIVCSPRIDKNTDIIVDSVIDGLIDNEVSVKKINIKDLNITHCTACGYCEKHGECVIKDDMTQLYKYFDEADYIIIGSPVYFNTVSSYAKMMIDRCQMFWSSKYILKDSAIDRNKVRYGLFVSVGGAPSYKKQFDSSVSVMELFFKAINASYYDNIFVSNTDKKSVEHRKEVIKQAYFIGCNLGQKIK